jgi:pimeloyl-ACP methyl ester carboxylesterase
MAGNVKEWTANPVGQGFLVTGGSWQDPMYVYSEFGEFPAMFSSPSLGFRCARSRPTTVGDQGSGPIDLEQRTPVYQPVNDATYRSLLTHYRYDRGPLNPRVVATVETANWTRLLVQFEGVADDTISAYLYLPTRAEPPFQTIVQVPGGSAFFGASVWDRAERVVGPHIKAGRAVLAVILRGMTERPWGAGYTPPPTNSVRFRDEMVLQATELRRGIDYLETRNDIDMTRLIYIGVSYGAGSRLAFAAVDDRYAAIVLIGAGVDERMHPTLPEALNINFAPRIEPAKLMLNGQQDEEHPWYTRGLPLWSLLAEPKELVLIEGGGHLPPDEARVPVINQWLDRTVGPVTPRQD